MKIMKDIKLKSLLKESVDYDYQDEFIQHLRNKNKKVDGWQPDYDSMSGTFMWVSGKHLIYATPFWEGEENLPIEVYEEGPDIIYQTSKRFKPSYNVKKDEVTYFKLLKPIFKAMK